MVLVSVGAAPVGVEADCHKEPLVEPHYLFLPVDSLVADEFLPLEGLDRPLVDRSDTRDEATGLHPIRVGILLGTLQAEGGRRPERQGARGVRPHGVRGSVHEPAVCGALHRVAGEAVRRQRCFVLQKVRRVDLVVLVELVDAAGQAELQSVTLRRERGPPEVGGTELSPDVLAVGEKGHRLERVGRLVTSAAGERVHRVIAVGVRVRQVENRRAVRKRVERARERVVVVREAAIVDGSHDGRTDAEAHAASHREVGIEAERLALRARADHGAVVLLDPARQEVPRGLRAAAHRQAGFVGEAVLSVELPLIVIEGIGTDRIRGVHELLGARRVTYVVSHRVKRGGFVGEDAGAREPDRVVTADALRHMELRLPVAAALGGNNDHAIRRPGAINRGRGCRALQHLHRLHVAGDEVGEPIGAVVLVARDAGADVAVRRPGDRVGARLNLLVTDDHSVHHVERLAVAKDRRHAADLHLSASARGAAVHVDQGAGHLALQRLLGRLRRNGVQLVARDIAHGGRRVAALHARGLPGYDYGLEVEHVSIQRELDARLCFGHFDSASLVPDRAGR